MKTNLSKWIWAIVVLAVVPAQAGIVDVTDVAIGGNQYRAFQDTTTANTWLALNNFFGTANTYNSVVALLAGSTFHVANAAELGALQASIPAITGNFPAEVVSVGGNYPGSPFASGTRSLMWGLYDDGNSTDQVSYSWKYDGDKVWNFVPNGMLATASISSVNTGNEDLGVWITGPSVGAADVVPEPGTMLLFGLGAIGLAIARRRLA